MKKLRLLSLLLVLVQILLALCACNGNEKPTTGVPTTATTEAPTIGLPPATTGKPVIDEPDTTIPELPTDPKDPYADYLQILDVKGSLDAAVLIPEDFTVAMQKPVDDFNSLIEDLMGEGLVYDYDTTTDVYDAEIVLFGTRGNAEAEEILAGMDEMECRVEVIGDTVYLLSKTRDVGMIQMLLDTLYDLLERRGETLMIPRSASICPFALPTFVSAAGTLANNAPYVTSNTNFQHTYNSVTRDEAMAYCDLLEEKGYTLYDENVIGRVEFFSYRMGECFVIVQYNDAEKFVRIGFAYGEYVPAIEEEPYEKLVEPSITNIKRFERSGLGLVIQLADGTYVILDGGYMGALAGNEAGRIDRDALYNFMVDNKPEEHEKPIISAWLLTHAHGDHDDAITAVLDAYRDNLDLRMFVHHFPDFTKHPTSSEGEGQGRNYYGEITLEMVREYCPDAIEWVARTGQRLKVGGAEIEIIYTAEDLYPIQPRGINDTNTTYRITIDGVEIMLLGDSDSYANRQMETYYGEALEADVLQMAHHSYNGEPKQYELIDPKICFWANFSYHDQYYKDRPCNQYLLNTRWTRTTEGGDVVSDIRTHVYNDQNCRIYLNEIP